MNKNSSPRRFTASNVTLSIFNGRLVLALVACALVGAALVFASGALAQRGANKGVTPLVQDDLAPTTKRQEVSRLEDGSTSAPNIVQAIDFFQGFETDNSGWNVFGGTRDATRVASGTNGVTSKTGGFHGQAATGNLEVNSGSAVTRWGGYNSTFPANGYFTSVDIYLNVAGGFANDTRFDWDSAINDSSGNFRRDFVFNAGYYSDAVAPGSGPRFVVSASNNAGRGSSFPKNPGRNPIVISSTGWYTFRHHFYNIGGKLAVDLFITDASNNVVGKWTLSNGADTIATTGGNRYGWFDLVEFPFLAFDNSSRVSIPSEAPIVVRPDALQGWQTVIVGTGPSVAFVTGPATPPLSSGSAQLSVGADGDNAAQLRHPGYVGTPLNNLTDLTYSTYVTQTGSGGQAPYIALNIDSDNDLSTIEDIIFFEPVYQNGGYSTVSPGDTIPNQCGANPNCVVDGTWQTWDALHGGWWANSDNAGGPPLRSLANYISLHPTARIANTNAGLGGVRIVAGFGAGAWDNFIGSVDAFRINVGANDPTYDFEPSPCASPTNVALPVSGGAATASSELSPNFPASGVINGEHDGTDWGAGGGWADGTPGDFSNDYVQVNLPASQPINEIDVYSLQDTFGPGAPAVTDTTTFTNYGLTSFEVQTSTGGPFTTVPGGNITGNNLVKRRVIFGTPVSATSIRVLVHGSADNTYSRVVEIEALSCNPTPCNNNVVLANGSTASASTVLSPNFPASGVRNGEHDGTDWGAGGGWADGTPGDFSNDYVQVDLSTTQSLSEIDVYTLQDTFGPGAPPVTDTTTFTNYGITSFEVQTSTGGPFTTVPGGNITGNNLVKRKFVFGAPVSASSIRVLVHGSADSTYSRVVELEAFTCAPATPTPTPSASPTATPCGADLALATNGSTATASSEVSPSFPASGVINGEHNGADWGSGGGWADGTPGDFSNDYVQVNLPSTQPLNEIDVYTLQDAFGPGAPPVTDTTTFTNYGITSFEVQVSTGGPFTTVTGGNITSNNLVKRKILFGSPVSASSIRILVHGSADNTYSRVVEVEAYSCNPATPTPTPSASPTPTPTPPPCGTNMALPANGGSASASTVLSPNFPASGVINGEHNGTDWGAGGGWADGTPGDFSNDYVQVALNAPQTIEEIDVFTLQDSSGPGAPAVTDTTTFTNYGITSFEVQASTGGPFTTVPGGNITGNNLVKRRIIFGSPITAKFIRVLVHGSADNTYSRVVELEVYSCTPSPVLCVNPGGTGGCYASIQAAINAANPGDSINVAAGTYTENVTVNKRVNLYGAQTGVNACGRAASESIITAGGGNLLTLVTGSAGTIIDGFTFSGAAIGITSTSGPINTVQIRNNRFVGFTASGIFLNDSGTDITVDQNSVDGASKVGGGDLIHLDTDGFAGFRLTNNCITGKGATDGSSGFFVDGNHNVGVSATRTPAISGNTITNCQTGMNLGSQAFTGGTISGNTYGNNLFDGLQGGIQLSSITGNIFSGNGRSGLALTSFGSAVATRGAQNTNVTCNTFTGNGFAQPTTGGGITFSASQAAGTISTNHANYNNISGNSPGARYSGTETIDAESNWWGSATGPTIGSNPGGTGDTIVGANIDYSPFANAVTTCTTTTVSPANQNGWVFFDDKPGTGTGSGGLESGPGIPPLGVGSAYLLVDSDGRFAVGTGAYVGTRMDAIHKQLYSTYQNGNANTAAAIAYQFDIDYDLTDVSNPYEGRLVFEPIYSGTVLQNVWQNWDTMPGSWYGTRDTVTVGNASVSNPCVVATRCTWQQVLTLYPNAGVRNPGAVLFKAGGPVSSNFDGNVDAFKFGIGNNLSTINFEPVP